MTAFDGPALDDSGLGPDPHHNGSMHDGGDPQNTATGATTLEDVNSEYNFFRSFDLRFGITAQKAQLLDEKEPMDQHQHQPHDEGVEDTKPRQAAPATTAAPPPDDVKSKRLLAFAPQHQTSDEARDRHASAAMIELVPAGTSKAKPFAATEQELSKYTGLPPKAREAAIRFERANAAAAAASRKKQSQPMPSSAVPSSNAPGVSRAAATNATPPKDESKLPSTAHVSTVHGDDADSCSIPPTESLPRPDDGYDVNYAYHTTSPNASPEKKTILTMPPTQQARSPPTVDECLDDSGISNTPVGVDVGRSVSAVSVSTSSATSSKSRTKAKSKAKAATAATSGSPILSSAAATFEVKKRLPKNKQYQHIKSSGYGMPSKRSVSESKPSSRTNTSTRTLNRGGGSGAAKAAEPIISPEPDFFLASAPLASSTPTGSARQRGGVPPSGGPKTTSTPIQKLAVQNSKGPTFMKSETMRVESGTKFQAAGRKRADAYAYSSNPSAKLPSPPLQQLIALTGLGMVPAASLLSKARGSVQIAAQAFLEDRGKVDAVGHLA